MIWSVLLAEILSMETSVCERPHFSLAPWECVRPRCNSLVCARLLEPSKDEMLELEVVRDRSLVILALDTGETGGSLMVLNSFIYLFIFALHIFFF